MTRIRDFGLIACLSLVPLACVAQQDNWPSKTIRLVITQAAGMPTDALGRMLSDSMSKLLGATVVIDNRAGAQGLVGMEHLAKAAPDGYTIGLGTQATLAIEPLVRKSLPYDAVRDYAPIAVIVDDTGGLAWFANASMPFTTLPEMIKYARANPGKVTYATNASSHVMLGQWLRKKAGIEMVEVPYKTEPQAYTDVLSGVVSTAISAPATLAPFVKAGKLRVLAVASPVRIPEWKDVGAIREIYPDFSLNSWVVLIAPAGVPEPIANRLNRAAAGALKDPAFQEQARKLRWVNHGGARTMQGTAAFIEEGRRDWANVINTIGITPQ